ncbi:MAG: RNase H family protein [Pirellulales bacterium]
MSAHDPAYTLLAEPQDSANQPGWRFVLQTDQGKEVMSADDREHGLSPQRLELLAVVRGLEALEQPSKVTILTPSQYVSRGLAYGLEEWRNNGWTWEHFGQMVLVKNHDLWQRLDRALSIHQVECRRWRFDAAHPAMSSASTPHSATTARRHRSRATRLLRTLTCWLFREAAPA